MKRNHITYRHPRELLELAIAAKDIADNSPEKTFGDIAELLNVTLESICFAVVRHWKWNDLTGYSHPVEIINAKKENE